MATLGTEESGCCREAKFFITWAPHIAEYWLTLSADTLSTDQSNISQHVMQVSVHVSVYISRPSVGRHVSRYLSR